MDIMTLTITDIKKPSRVNVFIYNPNTVDMESIYKDIRNTLFENYNITQSLSKFLEYSVKASKNMEHDTLYKVCTRGTVRFLITSKKLV